MNNKKELLNPAKLWFILFSMVIALIVNFIPLGKLVWRPDILGLVLVYWSIHQPKKVSFLWVFFLGLLMDVHYGTLLGQYALAYILVSAIAVAIGRRMMWFDMAGQMLHVFPLFVVLHFVLVLVSWLNGGSNLSWWAFGAPIIETLLWPVADFLLLRPQKSAPDEEL